MKSLLYNALVHMRFHRFRSKLYAFLQMTPPATVRLLVGVLLCSLIFTGATNREMPRRGKDFALFIAVTNYQQWSELKHPIAEVEKIAAELYQNYEFDTLILRNPSQDEIITTLRNYNKVYPSGDEQLLIYFSGHGEFDELTKEGFFIPRDGKLNDKAQTSYLAFSRLQRIVESINCRHILLAIDACYSGTFDRLVALRDKGELRFGRPGETQNVRDQYIKNELTLQSRYFIASGKKVATPDASNFAAYFLRALRNGGRDHNILTMFELVAELQKAQPKPHFSTFQGHQEESNFLFVKKISAAPPTNYNAMQDRADWQEALRINTAAAYQKYLDRQAKGEFRALATQKYREREAEEREVNDWAQAKYAANCDGYQNFLRDHPQSLYKTLAEDSIKKYCQTPTPTPIAQLEADMVRIASGAFTMGCKDAQRYGNCYADEKPSRTVQVSAFSLGRYEVTQAQWRAVMGSDPPELRFKGCDNCPVERVSWDDIQEFLQKLNALTGKKYRLPSEAEWEYAARGGAQSRGYLYSGSNNADEVAWYDDNSNSKTHPVGGKKPNELGLYDMSGNVWEWCEDDWHDTYQNAPTDSRPWVDRPRGGSRVLRGGSWNFLTRYLRVANRDWNKPEDRNVDNGFRLARD